MTETLELRYSDLEYRSGDSDTGPGIVSGIVVRYGDVATLPWGRERFQPGALKFADVMLDFQHQRSVPLARTGGGGLEVREVDGAVMFRAVLPDTSAGRDVATLTRGRVLRGASAGFVTVKSRIDSGVRVIERGTLKRIGLVDEPQYPDSHIVAMREKWAAEWSHGRPVHRAYWL